MYSTDYVYTHRLRQSPKSGESVAEANKQSKAEALDLFIYGLVISKGISFPIRSVASPHRSPE